MIIAEKGVDSTLAKLRVGGSALQQWRQPAEDFWDLMDFELFARVDHSGMESNVEETILILGQGLFCSSVGVSFL